MPSLVIVPGSFSGPEHYAALLPLLQKDYEVIVGTLQTADRSPPRKPATLQEDAAYFRGIIETLASQGKDVVIIGHSFGGMVATESVQGVTKQEREAKGLKGGVVKIIYFASVLPEIGQSCLDVQGEEASAPGFRVDDDFMYLDEEIGASIFYELPAEEATKWGKLWHAHSTPSFKDPLTFSAVDLVPAVWLFTANDVVVPPARQTAAIERLQGRNAKQVSVVHLETGHLPNVTAPKELARAILEVVE